MNNAYDIDEARAEGLTSSGREELRRLHRDFKRLQAERNLLKRAAACFAEGDRDPVSVSTCTGVPG